MVLRRVDGIWDRELEEVWTVRDFDSQFFFCGFFRFVAPFASFIHVRRVVTSVYVMGRPGVMELFAVTRSVICHLALG